MGASSTQLREQPSAWAHTRTHRKNDRASGGRLQHCNLGGAQQLAERVMARQPAALGAHNGRAERQQLEQAKGSREGADDATADSAQAPRWQANIPELSAVFRLRRNQRVEAGAVQVRKRARCVRMTKRVSVARKQERRRRSKRGGGQSRCRRRPALHEARQPAWSVYGRRPSLRDPEGRLHATAKCCCSAQAKQASYAKTKRWLARPAVSGTLLLCHFATTGT